MTDMAGPVDEDRHICPRARAGGHICPNDDVHVRQICPSPAAGVPQLRLAVAALLDGSRLDPAAAHTPCLSPKRDFTAIEAARTVFATYQPREKRR